MALSAALKFKFSMYSALLFFLIASPATYSLTNSIIGGTSVGGCPTAFGLIVHTLVFLAASYGIMLLPRDPY
jgi:predicted ABC-type sugar transport system permease subunit